MIDNISTIHFLKEMLYLIPLLILVFSSMIILLVDVFAESSNKRYLAPLTSLFLIFSAISIFWLYKYIPKSGVKILYNMVYVDHFSLVISAMLIIAAIITVWISSDYLERYGIAIGEFYSLLLISLTGMILMVSTTNLFTMFVALELFSIPIYVLAGFFRVYGKSIESSIKYFISGSVASAIMLYGIALFYGVFGTVEFSEIERHIFNHYDSVAQIAKTEPLLILGTLLIMAGFLFKTAMIPFHMWTPDIYEGAPTTVTGFMGFAVKATSFAAFFRVVVSIFNTPSLVYSENGTISPSSWINVIYVLIIITLIVSNLIAMSQRNVKRMLAYSSISHAAYLMIAILTFSLSKTKDSYGSLLFYLLTYLFASIGAFAVLSIFEKNGSNSVTLENLNGASKRSPFLVASMLIFIFSMAGVPPFGGFFGKFYLLKSAFVDGSLSTLVLIAVITSVIGAFYYLRVLVFMFMKDVESDENIETLNVPFLGKLAIALSAIAVVYLGVFPNSLIQFMGETISNFFIK
ncbi:NADH-quinone oxidoreductase subunit N [bacterium]|nr:NADH-quinone oxidoreductase subunit N [bacterium]